MSATKSKVLIIVEGGCVQGIISNGDIDVHLIDKDNAKGGSVMSMEPCSGWTEQMPDQEFMEYLKREVDDTNGKEDA